MAITNKVRYTTLAITADTASYGAGDSIGGALSIANAARIAAGGGYVKEISLACLTPISPEIDVVFFNTAPTTDSTITNNAAIDIADAQITYIAGFTSLTSDDWCAFADNCVASKAVEIPYKLTSGTALTIALIARAAFQLTDATDFKLILGMQPD